MNKRLRVLSRKTVYQGRIIRLVLESLEYRRRRLIREVVEHPGAAVIVPLLDRSRRQRGATLPRQRGRSRLDRSRVVLVRQYRRPIRRELLELPAGTLSPGERRDACARRELEEETGWKARRLRRIGQYYAAPGFCTEQLTIFLAEGLTQATAHPEPDESLKPVILPLKAALAKVRSGAICDAKTIIGLLFVERLLARRATRPPSDLK